MLNWTEFKRRVVALLLRSERNFSELQNAMALISVGICIGFFRPFECPFYWGTILSIMGLIQHGAVIYNCVSLRRRVALFSFTAWIVLFVWVVMTATNALSLPFIGVMAGASLLHYVYRRIGGSERA